MFPAQPHRPAASAKIEPRAIGPELRSRLEKARPSMTGSMPSVERAWVCAPVRASPITLPRTAQTPQQKSARRVEMNQRGVIDVRACDRARGGRARRFETPREVLG